MFVTLVLVISTPPTPESYISSKKVRFFSTQSIKTKGKHNFQVNKFALALQPSGSSLLALIQYRAIRPMHIREAYRRFHESSTPMATFCVSHSLYLG